MLCLSLDPDAPAVNCTPSILVSRNNGNVIDIAFAGRKFAKITAENFSCTNKKKEKKSESESHLFISPFTMQTIHPLGQTT